MAVEEGLEIFGVGCYAAARRLLSACGLRLVVFSGSREIWHALDTRVGLFDYQADNGDTYYRVCLPAGAVVGRTRRRA